MAAYKLNIARIEGLITQYVCEHGIDSSAQKLMAVKEKLNIKKFPEFNDIIFFACTLNVSPDYITGASDEFQVQDPYLLKILTNYMQFNVDCKYSLAEKSEQYLNIQNSFADFDKSGITVKIYNADNHLINENEAYPKFNETCQSMVAEIKAEYDKNQED